MTALALVKTTIKKQAGNLTIQKNNSNYSSIKEIDALFKELFVDSGLNFNESTKKFYKANFAIPSENGIASTCRSIKTMCDKADISTTSYYKYVQADILNILGEEIFIIEKTTKMQENRKQRNNGTPYRYLRPAKEIRELIVKAQIRHGIIQEKSPVQSPVQSPVHTSSPCESKAEEQKKSEHALIMLKDYKNQDIKNNRFKENDSFKQPVKKFGIKKEIKAFLQSYAFFNAFGDDLTKHEIEKRVQLAFIKTDTDYTDIDNQEAVKKALHSFVRTYEKENNLRDKEKYFGALYRCLVNELKKQANEALQEEPSSVLEACDLNNLTNILHLDWLKDGQQEPQEAAGAPENDLEYFDIQIKQMDAQEQNEEPTEEDYAEAFCYGHPFFEHKPFEIFDREFNSFGEWKTPLMPLTDSDELKYYDRIIEREEETTAPINSGVPKSLLFSTLEV